MGVHSIDFEALRTAKLIKISGDKPVQGTWKELRAKFFEAMQPLAEQTNWQGYDTYDILCNWFTKRMHGLWTQGKISYF